jgi:hypothetical protein
MMGRLALSSVVSLLALVVVGCTGSEPIPEEYGWYLIDSSKLVSINWQKKTAGVKYLTATLHYLGPFGVKGQEQRQGVITQSRRPVLVVYAADELRPAFSLVPVIPVTRYLEVSINGYMAHGEPTEFLMETKKVKYGNLTKYVVNRDLAPGAYAVRGAGREWVLFVDWDKYTPVCYELSARRDRPQRLEVPCPPGVK